jgi:arylsulfatase A-like enzyme
MRYEREYQPRENLPMKAIMVMFDSLNRHLLPPYGCEWVQAPNFARLAQRTVSFERAYIGSMPCMPARREIHTGRPNFLHRSWGPLEPFDDSMPELLKNGGVHTHLATDHYHYFEDGGATYHTRYSTWEFFRGQEGDPWIGQVAEPPIPPVVAPRQGAMWRQDWVNRRFMRREPDQPQPQTFAAGLEFMRRNHRQDNWFLQIETFDPHEPFFTQRKYKDRYAEHYRNYKGRQFDWPPYRRVEESPAEIEHCRHEYAALLTMCDAYLGDVLDQMDELQLWQDTMLIVCTDHGFLLGEHDCWAKVWMPWYQELANVPLFIWDPRCATHGQRRRALVQTIDVAPTLLEFFNITIPPDMLGRPLRDTIAADTPVRQAGLFGMFGGHVNVTDGRYVYMRAPATPENQPLFQYTHMPTHMRHPFTVDELQQIAIAEPFRFTKGCPTMKIAGRPMMRDKSLFRNYLWDIESDPRQQQPLTNPKIEQQMIEYLVGLMRDCDAPRDQFQRLGLT